MNFSKNREVDFMKKVIKAITSAALSGCMLMPFFSMGASAYSSETANNALIHAMSYIDGSRRMGDYNNDGNVDVSDARSLLRLTAGLENAPNDDEFDYRCDMDGDGLKTPADARLVLRIASKLDKYDISYLNFFNASLNTVKANNSAFRAKYNSVIQKKDYDNKELAHSFESQMNDFINGINKFSKKDEDKLSNFYFDKEFKTIDHNSEDDYTYVKNNTVCSASRAVKFPLTGSEMGSLLEFSDVLNIEYNDDDIAEFSIESPWISKETGKQDILFGPESTGKCSSVTIYMKPEKYAAIPENRSEISYGRVYNLPEFGNTSGDLFGGADKDFNQFLNASGNFDNVSFSDSYIKLYFNNDSSKSNYGKPIYIDYHLNYSFDVYCHLIANMSVREILKALDVDVSKFAGDLIAGLIGVPSVNVNDYITMSTWYSDRTQFYFELNKW